MNWAILISKLGNSGLLLPLSLCLAGLLWRYESWRAAFYLIAAVGGCAAATLALKIVFLVCGQDWGSAIVTPSAHASISATVYGALAAVTVRQESWWRRTLIIVATALFIVAIAVSRIALSVHSPEEVTLGLVLGAGAASAFAYQYLRLPIQKRIDRTILLAGTSAIVLMLYGVYVPFEEMAYDIALRSRATLHFCPAQ